MMHRHFFKNYKSENIVVLFYSSKLNEHMSNVPSTIIIVWNHEDDQESIYSDEDSESTRYLKSSEPIHDSPYLKYSLAPWPRNKKPRFDHPNRGYKISPLHRGHRNWIQTYCYENKRKNIQKWSMERNKWGISKGIEESMGINKNDA